MAELRLALGPASVRAQGSHLNLSTNCLLKIFQYTQARNRNRNSKLVITEEGLLRSWCNTVSLTCDSIKDERRFVVSLLQFQVLFFCFLFFKTENVLMHEEALNKLLSRGYN